MARTAHTVVYVATVNHSICAFAADNEAELWMKNYRVPTSFVPLCHGSAFNTSPYQGAGMIRTAIDHIPCATLQAAFGESLDPALIDDRH